MGLIPHAPKLSAFAAGSLFLAAAAAPAAAAPSYSLEGNASQSGGTFTLTSNFNSVDPNKQFGSIDLNVPSDLQFSEISQLSATVIPGAGDDCGGGAPRFSLNTSLGSNKNVFVYFGTPPNFSCPGGSSIDIVNNPDARFDLSQLGGPFYATYSEAVAFLNNLGNPTITGVQLVVDAGWFMGDKKETFTVSNLVFKTTEDNNGGGNGNGGTPTSKDQCKKGGWQTFTNPTFKNQGQCVAYVNRQNGVGNDDNRQGGDQNDDQGGKNKNKNNGRGNDKGNED